jgi:hypothetical protein
MLLSPKLFRVTLFTALVAGAACAFGCSSSNATSESDPLSVGIVREGTTTNAALKAFLDAQADEWPWAGGQFVTPVNQAVLPAATPEVFSWTAVATDGPDAGDTLLPSEQQGAVFLLVFSTPSNAQLLRVFTSLTAYTPDATAWQTLVGAGGTITLSITAATFENDQLTGDGGPHNGEIITFTIQ